jgi:hypothetical protein
MSYNLTTTRTRIEQKLDDTSFGTTKLNQFINDGQRYILNNRRFRFMEKEADLTTTSGSDAVTGTPTDLQTPLSLRLYSPAGNAIKLQYVEYEDIDNAFPNISNSGNSAPSAWYVFNNTIKIYPQADATYTLKLKYIKTVDELSEDADIPEIPEDFSEALVLAGYQRALEHNDDYDQAQVVQLKIDELIDKMDERYKRQAGQPHIMRSSRGGHQKFGG